jgi:4-amino-4-deoxy-L-arabinose transferase-like glycosyltransferase
MSADRSEKQLFLLSALLLLVGLFLHLGTQPLYLEEPRRALIAMEMWERGNWWVPTELGDFYYNKPPFFNWVLMLSAALLGGFHEWAMRLPTVLSTLGIAALLFFIGRRYVDAAFGRVSALLFVSCGSVLIFFSHLGEIDLFYAFISFGSFAALFHFYQIRKDWLLFLSFYALHAIGFLTKGLPSVLFIALTLTAWFAYRRDIRRFFSWAHLAGIGLFAALIGGYLYQYSRFHSLALLLPQWIGQAGERTVAEQGWQKLAFHLVHYPLDTLKDLLPFSLLLLFLIRRDWLASLRRNAWVSFAAVVFAANFPVYWLSPGAKQRYLYMLFPLIIVVLSWAWRHADELKPWRSKAFMVLVGVFVGALALGSPAIGWIADLEFLPYRHWLGFGAAVVFGLIFWSWMRRKLPDLYALILAMAILRIVFDLSVLPQRAQHSGAQYDRQTAVDIARITAGEELYIYGDERISFTTVYYLNRLRGQCLVRNAAEKQGVFYIARQDETAPSRQVFYTFEYDKAPYVLFQL